MSDGNEGISPAQLKKLQTLWGQYSHRSLADAIGDARATRLTWAGTRLGRNLESFNDLSRDEGKRLIDALLRALGISSRREAMGTDGRRNQQSSTFTFASRSDLNFIRQAYERLGWSAEHFEQWLRSASSPLGGRAEIRTQADANRVRWALKNMLKHRGLWHEPQKFDKPLSSHSAVTAVAYTIEQSITSS